MKKILCFALTVMLLMTSVSALAAAKKTENNYTMKTAGYVVLQNVADRNITPNAGELDVNPVIEGESPVTGLPYDTSARYMPIIVQISNSEASESVDGTLTFTAAEKLARGQELTKNDKKAVKVASAGIASRAPWGGQYADIVYEGILYRDGATRISFLFNDVLADGFSVTAGPVRSARIGHVLLREEWGGGIAYCGGPRAEENNIAAMFAELGASTKGVAFDIETSVKAGHFNERVQGVKAPTT